MKPRSPRTPGGGPGNVTSHDVARLAGVSQTTVSRALRNVASVPPATRDRVVRAATALGYVPNQNGRSLSTRATRRIALVMDLGNPLSPSLLTPVHDELAASGYQSQLFAEHRGQLHALEGLFDRSVDGAILSTVTLDSPLPGELARHGTPFVYLNRVHDVVERDSVRADDRGGAAAMARLLLELGHRDFGLILGPVMTSTSRDREAGFVQALAEHQVAVPPRWVTRGDFTEASGRAAFDQAFRATPRPTAVFCASDWTALGALNGARAAGITVPQDISIVGFDDLPLAGWATINLTTVANPVQQSSVTAARALLRRLAATPGDPYVHVVSPTRLVPRATHAAPAHPAAPPS